MDSKGAALPVTGANADMGRIAAFIAAHGTEIKQIHVTLDSHQEIDIAHPAWWIDAGKKTVAPRTPITAEQIENNTYTTFNDKERERSLKYVKELEKAEKNHFIWPVHCLIGTHGHNVQEYLVNFLYKWELENHTRINFIAKGTNEYTEHYGALKAEIPNEDPATQLNEDFLKELRKASVILVCGEALSHCVKETVNQLVAYIGEEYVQRIKVLTDASSPVDKVSDELDFPKQAKEWLIEMEKRGVGMTTTTTFFK